MSLYASAVAFRANLYSELGRKNSHTALLGYKSEVRRIIKAMNPWIEGLKRRHDLVNNNRIPSGLKVYETIKYLITK